MRCHYCKKKLFRRNGWLNENKKLNQQNYCSLGCLGKSRRLREKLVCENLKCNRTFERKKSNVSPHNYCSHSCAMVVNNTKFPKKKALVKVCLFCGENYIGSAIKFCSTICKNKAAIVRKDEIVKWIREFYVKNNRIPIKSEYHHYSAAQLRFGSWNKAILEAGFDPNPVIFAKKYVANDGHKCDSLSEKIIDDWLYARKINHIINYPYPGNLGFTTDFKVKNYWIEFFGLSGELKRYDELKLEKINLVKKNKLKMVAIYPKDLFPTNHLDKILEKVIK